MICQFDYIKHSIAILVITLNCFQCSVKIENGKFKCIFSFSIAKGCHDQSVLFRITAKFQNIILRHKVEFQQMVKHKNVNMPSLFLLFSGIQNHFFGLDIRQKPYCNH